MGKFEEVYAVNVNDKTEKKGNLTYLSWAWAWAEFKKLYPGAMYKVDQFDGAFCSGNEKTGYMVRTEVTAGEQTYEMWLPVMDMRNNTILSPKMTEINKAIMRCLTKNLAMFGLGLYIYAGEDLPEDGETEYEQPRTHTATVDRHATAKNQARNEPKTNDTAKSFQPLTRSEMVEKWGVKSAEGVVAYFEKEFGKKLEEFDECETDAARVFLEKKKQEREAKERQERYKNANGDAPFPED